MIGIRLKYGLIALLVTDEALTGDAPTCNREEEGSNPSICPTNVVPFAKLYRVRWRAVR